MTYFIWWRTIDDLLYMVEDDFNGVVILTNNAMKLKVNIKYIEKALLRIMLM